MSSAVVERLKAVSKEALELGKIAGFAAGKEFASEDLAPVEIKAVVAGQVEDVLDWLGNLELNRPDPDFFEALEARAVESGDDDAYMTGWKAGFCGGVKTVWDEVKSQL